MLATSAVAGTHKSTVNPMKHFFFFLLWLAACSTYGQASQRIHQTFSLQGATQLKVELPGECEIVPWPGSSVLTEVVVEMPDASSAVLRHFTDVVKRYHLRLDVEGEVATLRALDPQRETLIIRGKTLTEVVHQKIYVPEHIMERSGLSASTAMVRPQPE
ncbi:MAG: hypothetical protein KatS3mg101_1114 [Patescibacteria group bacterium]|nr:MAG: hypothetical protein KatS3mg101_1114 [Patescibacteria group bacterium]